MELISKFVDYSYCASCKHKDTKEEDDPCNECLNEPAREDGSRKPIKYEEIRLAGS